MAEKSPNKGAKQDQVSVLKDLYKATSSQKGAAVKLIDSDSSNATGSSVGEEKLAEAKMDKCLVEKGRGKDQQSYLEG